MGAFSKGTGKQLSKQSFNYVWERKFHTMKRAWGWVGGSWGKEIRVRTPPLVYLSTYKHLALVSPTVSCRCAHSDPNRKLATFLEEVLCCVFKGRRGDLIQGGTIVNLTQ